MAILRCGGHRFAQGALQQPGRFGRFPGGPPACGLPAQDVHGPGGAQHPGAQQHPCQPPVRDGRPVGVFGGTGVQLLAAVGAQPGQHGLGGLRFAEGGLLRAGQQAGAGEQFQCAAGADGAQLRQGGDHVEGAVPAADRDGPQDFEEFGGEHGQRAHGAFPDGFGRAVGQMGQMVDACGPAVPGEASRHRVQHAGVAFGGAGRRLAERVVGGTAQDAGQDGAHSRPPTAGRG
ncbi:hypothetical protein GCM10020000_08480 [Streptomyces olivoverticillatus]